MEAGGIGTFDWNLRTNAVVWTEPSNAAFARPAGEAFRGAYDDWAKQSARKTCWSVRLAFKRFSERSTITGRRSIE